MSTPAPATPPPSPAAVPVLLLLVFLSLVGFGVVIPLLPFFATAFEAAAWQVALLFAVYSAGQFLGELVWGRLSDRVGRRPILLVTIVGSGLGYLALAFAPGIWIAVLVRFAAGFFSGNMSVIQGYIVDVSPPHRLAARLGLIGSAFGVGFVVGPALGGLMARPDLGAAGFRPPLLMAAGLCALATVGIIIWLRESRRITAGPVTARRNPLEALGTSMRHPILSRAFGVIFFGFFASSAMWSVLGLWTDARFGWGPREVGFVMACTGLVSATTQGFATGVVVRRLGEGRTILVGLSFSGLCIFLMALAPWGWAAGLALVTSMLGHALWQPAATAIVSSATDPDRQGAVLGAASASGSLSRVIGPIFGGVLFSSVGPWAPIVFAAVFMLPGAWLGWKAAQALKARAV